MASPDLLQDDAPASTDVQTLVTANRTASDSPDDPMRHRDLAARDRVEQQPAVELSTDDPRPEQRLSEREIFHPLLPSKTAEVDVWAMPPETVSGDAASARFASIGLQHNPLDTSIVGAARMAHVAVEDGPTEDRRDAIAPPPVNGLRERAGMLAAVAGDAGKPVRAGSSVPRRRSERSDEIQIHIGRIEVTAVPQPTPRPGATPARKAMSLDEYLGRDRRGAR